MKDNGTKIFFTIVFVVLCGYYLFPSVQNLFMNRKIESLEGEERENYINENYTRTQQIQEKSLKLGLDLLGGMHVTLEVRLDALLRELATDTDETFLEVLAEAHEASVLGSTDMIDEFANRFEDRDSEARLSRYFRDDDANINRRSTNDEVVEYLKQESEDAILRAIEIIRQRVDRFGVTEPSIQRQGTRRIVVELPGIDDEERVRSLLKGTARLEFRMMTDPQDIVRTLQQMIAFHEEAPADSIATDSVAADAMEMGDDLADTMMGDSAVAADTTEDLADLLAMGDEALSSGNALLDIFQPVGQGVVYGYVSEGDTASFNVLIEDPVVKDMLPIGTTMMYTASPIGVDDNGFEMFAVLGVREEVELDGSVVTDARVEFDEVNRAEVSMNMNSEGARTWSRLTGANVGRNVAVVLDNVVYSYPVVNERIPSGRTSISGLDSQAEAQDVVTILKSGALPAPVEIVEERTVGPSLGAASIRAGLMSIIVGLMVVALFMIFYYQTAGLVADLALIINIIFILGILAAFQATLTLPGIAGIVLTIGMAVDANVLIFERVREEQTTGKTLKASIEGGYGKALSAIVDANITTFFVAAILYSFGVGPIQGFAVTLMAGIAASMFSAIVITRIVFDWMVIGRKMKVSYG